MTKQGLIIESNKDYHSYKEAISKSRLAKMSVCPSYFKWAETAEIKPSAEMVIGSATHKLILEPTDFDREFVVSPNFDRRTKQGKEDYADFLAWLGIVTGKQIGRAHV